MVGSVLIDRMRAERDFDLIDEPVFFTTSQVGEKGPEIGRDTPLLQDAHDLAALLRMDAILSCQGGITLQRYFPGCVVPAGRGTGSMPLPHYG